MTEPTKILLFSEHDLPTREATPADALLGIPAVIEFKGEPHHIRSSPYVPAGQVYVIDVSSVTPSSLHLHQETRQ